MSERREHLADYVKASEELAELQATFDLRWKADMRAIKAWQHAHPDRKHVWPDHADLVVWLMEQLAIEAEAIAAERADCGRKVRDVARAIRDTEIPQAIAAERARIAKTVEALAEKLGRRYQSVGQDWPTPPEYVPLVAVLRIVNPEEAKG